jgi:proton glutamate symport protein
MSLTTRVLLGLIAGAAAGLLVAWVAPGAAADLAAVVAPIGTLWLNGLQMTVVPLIVALLVTGVAAAGGAALSGRIARRAVVVFAVLLAGAAAFAALLAPLAFAVVPRDERLVDAVAGMGSGQAPVAAASLADWLSGIIPKNAIAAAADGAILSLVVFALFFAFGLTRIAPDRRLRVVEFFQAIADTMVVVIRWILWVGPLGVFALIFPVCATAGAGLIGALGSYVVVQVVLVTAATAALYGVAVVVGGERLRRFAGALLPAQAIAASTQSSLASLPAMVQSAERLGHPPATTALVLPMAVSLFRGTVPVSYLCAAAFIAWAHGIELSAVQLATGAAVAVVVSLGGVSLPGGVSFLATHGAVAQAMGLPLELLGILLAVDLIPDMVGTIGNVTADVTANSVVARSVGPDAGAPLPPGDG